MIAKDIYIYIYPNYNLFIFVYIFCYHLQTIASHFVKTIALGLVNYNQPTPNLTRRKTRLQWSLYDLTCPTLLLSLTFRGSWENCSLSSLSIINTKVRALSHYIIAYC